MMRSPPQNSTRLDPLISPNELSVHQEAFSLNTIRTIFVAFAIALLVSGCAQVPKESVELSATLGRDLQEVQQSHRRSVDLLFDRDVERISNYIDNVATPAFIAAAIKALGAEVAQNLADATKPTASADDRQRAFDRMAKIVKQVTDRLAKQRKELIDPLEAVRKETLAELDRAYTELQRANTVVTAHLASVVKVHSLQDDLLAKAGLKDFRSKVGDEALKANSKVTDAISDASEVEAVLTALKEAVAKLKK
jgi:hypothetical protein